MSIWGKVLGGAINPIAKIFEKREERKKAIGEIKAQAASAEVDGKVAVSLSKAEWEIISKNAEPTTWKDEYITLLITSPLLVIFIGNIVAAFGFGTALIDANTASLQAIKAVGIDMGELMLVTVLAAIGIKAIK
jgi:hypothetical protein